MATEGAQIGDAPVRGRSLGVRRRLVAYWLILPSGIYLFVFLILFEVLITIYQIAVGRH